MAEMGFQASDETDVDSLFPKEVKMNVNEFMSGIVFNDDIDCETTNYNTIRSRTRQFFRQYVDDVHSGKEGTTNAVCGRLDRF